MTDIAASAGESGAAREAWLAAWAPTALVFAAAIVIRCVSHLNNDVSWLLVLGEKMASGARPYVDFLEVNPPASILLYYPAVLIGHALGVSPEFVVNVMVFAAVAASLAFCASLVRAARLADERDLGKLGGLTAFVLLILPCYTFAQRENLALVAILPALCVYAARAAGRHVNSFPALIAGVGSGLAICIKPYFALALMLPFAFVLWRQRGSRKFSHLLFVAENLAALSISIAYVALVLLEFPAFLRHELPLVMAVYIPVRLPAIIFMCGPSSLLFVMGTVTAIWIAGKRVREATFAIPLLAAFGFFTAAAIEGKGWPYHGYPAIALVTLVSASLIAFDSLSKKLFAQIGLFALLVAASASWLNNNGEKPLVLDALRHKNIPHPKMLIISGIDIFIGHPVTRQLDGSWAGTACSMWITENGRQLLSGGGLDTKVAQTIRHYMVEDRALIVRDITNNAPDIILINGKAWHVFAMSHPDLRAALGKYRNDETVDGVEIWLRKKRA